MPLYAPQETIFRVEARKGSKPQRARVRFGRRCFLMRFPWFSKGPSTGWVSSLLGVSPDQPAFERQWCGVLFETFAADAGRCRAFWSDGSSLVPQELFVNQHSSVIVKCRLYNAPLS